jgi:hypothetical protein
MFIHLRMGKRDLRRAVRRKLTIWGFREKTIII